MIEGTLYYITKVINRSKTSFSAYSKLVSLSLNKQDASKISNYNWFIIGIFITMMSSVLCKLVLWSITLVLKANAQGKLICKKEPDQITLTKTRR